MNTRIRIAALAGLCSAVFFGSLGGTPSGFGSLPALAGRSGKLLAVFTLPDEVPTSEVPAVTRRPGVYSLRAFAAAGYGALRWIVLTPFSSKVNGSIGGYRMGEWPFEHRDPSDPAYANPRGFIQVTSENFRTRVSEHFSLGQFLTKNQANVWPKYLVLQPRLLDKLELTIAELKRQGHPVSGLFVMSGFRTPDYNEPGVGAGGRSAVSRHQYGDAADVYPDTRDRGRMDDLNRDGRVDLKDARILARAAEAVEEAHPELTGGIGIYPATSAHGPFVHIDARGKRARWGG
ncbi:MAG: hypothetical protein ABI592_01195 [Acidobacteriota bacterium]